VKEGALNMPKAVDLTGVQGLGVQPLQGGEKEGPLAPLLYFVHERLKYLPLVGGNQLP
jgi:hypothetical protein